MISLIFAYLFCGYKNDGYYDAIFFDLQNQIIHLFLNRFSYFVTKLLSLRDSFFSDMFIIYRAFSFNHIL